MGWFKLSTGAPRSVTSFLYIEMFLFGLYVKSPSPLGIRWPILRLGCGPTRRWWDLAPNLKFQGWARGQHVKRVLLVDVEDEVPTSVQEVGVHTEVDLLARLPLRPLGMATGPEPMTGDCSLPKV